jgi:DNA-binding NtrC family response regulator
VSYRVVVVDDDSSMCELIEDDLRSRGIDVTTFTSPEQAVGEVEKGVDLVITDIRMPGMTGTELCRRVAAQDSEVPVIVMTAFGSLEMAIEAIRAGAFDFVTKPVELDLLAISVDRALAHKALRDRVQALSEEVERSSRLGELLGESRPMHRLFEQISRVADSEATILVTGESGTGKELVARALHRGSRRSKGTMVSVNCAALPENLLESELFGHSRGAFTGAGASRKGLFLEADGGTLYLDEISELPLALQPKLLRALEESAVRPVGSDREVPFDARLIVATNRDLDGLVRTGKFREDLYYRINVIEIEVPSLRERGNDVLLLAQHFITEFASRSGREVDGISSPAARRLLSYGWPGNVRELRNAMERAVALARRRSVELEDLPDRMRSHGVSLSAGESDEPADLESLAEVERRHILRTLETLRGNRTKTAEVLGCDRKTLYRKLRSFGIDGRQDSHL